MIFHCIKSIKFEILNEVNKSIFLFIIFHIDYLKIALE